MRGLIIVLSFASEIANLVIAFASPKATHEPIILQKLPRIVLGISHEMPPSIFQLLPIILKQILHKGVIYGPINIEMISNIRVFLVE